MCDLLIGEVAGGVFAPDIASDGLTTRSKVTCANREEAAVLATPSDVVGFMAELIEEGALRRVAPDFAKRFLLDRADGFVAPELVRVDGAIPADAGEAIARGVAAIHLEEGHDIIGLGVTLFDHAHPEVGSIAVVVDGEDFERVTEVEAFFRLINDEVDRIASFLGIKVVAGDLCAASAVDQVVEADTGDLFLAHESKDCGDVLDIVSGDGDAETDFDTRITTVANRLNGAFVGTSDTPKFIMGGLLSVDTDADIARADLLDGLGDLGGDECAIGREDDAHLFVDGILGELEEVGPGERFSARE